MRLFPFGSQKKEINSLKAELDNIKNMAAQALYQYTIHNGQINAIADNPAEYLEKGYSGNTSVYSVISRIDNMSRQAKLVLKDKAGNVIEDHELLKFTNKVNPDLSFSDFKTAFFIYRLTTGEHFTYKLSLDAGPNKGKVLELHVLPADIVQIIEGTPFAPVRGYKVDGNYNLEMPKEKVHHSKLYNPNWGQDRSLHGMSPLRAAAKTVSKLNQIETTEIKAFENQGPPYILFKDTQETMQRLTEEQQEALTGKIKDHTRRNKGLPFVAKDKLGMLTLGQNLSDMTVIESSNSGVIALCAVYQFPPELMGYGQKTYNNMGTARKAAWTDCIMPNLDTFIDLMNACTIEGVKEYEGLTWEFDYSEVEELQEGMEIKVGWMNAAGWTGNEVRTATGKIPSDNPIMDEPRVPMGTTLASDYNESLDEGEKDFSDYKPK